MDEKKKIKELEDKLKELLEEYVDLKLFDDDNELVVTGSSDIEEHINISHLCPYPIDPIRVCHGEYSIYKVYADWVCHAENSEGVNCQSEEDALDYLREQDEKHGHCAPKIIDYNHGSVEWLIDNK